MWGFLSTVFLLWCVWRIGAWIWARRKLKKQQREEEMKRKAEEERVAEFWRRHAEETEERRRRQHENYISEQEAEAKRKGSMEYRLEQEERMRAAAEREKEEIAAALKERQRRRELEKQVRQELIDSGELFGDQTKRPPIPREVVDAVYRRDQGRCVYCGSTENLQLDHIIPFSKGGATTLENLQLLCQKCNLEKSNKIG